MRSINVTTKRVTTDKEKMAVAFLTKTLKQFATIWPSESFHFPQSTWYSVQVKQVFMPLQNHYKCVKLNRSCIFSNIPPPIKSQPNYNQTTQTTLVGKLEYWTHTRDHTSNIAALKHSSIILAVNCTLCGVTEIFNCKKSKVK